MQVRQLIMISNRRIHRPHPSVLQAMPLSFSPSAPSITPSSIILSSWLASLLYCIAPTLRLCNQLSNHAHASFHPPRLPLHRRVTTFFPCCCWPLAPPRLGTPRAPLQTTPRRHPLVYSGRGFRIEYCRPLTATILSPPRAPHCSWLFRSSPKLYAAVHQLRGRCEQSRPTWDCREGGNLALSIPRRRVWVWNRTAMLERQGWAPRMCPCGNVARE
jgi:hypothetical protein